MSTKIGKSSFLENAIQRFLVCLPVAKGVKWDWE